MTQWQLGKYSWSVISTNIFAVIFAAVIIWLCIANVHDAHQAILNALVTLIGALGGWAVGMFFVPYTKDEALRFAAVGKTVSAFASGYVISKLDRFLEIVMFQKVVQGGQQTEILVNDTWMRMGLFLCSMLLVFLTVFSNRSYFRSE